MWHNNICHHIPKWSLGSWGQENPWWQSGSWWRKKSQLFTFQGFNLKWSADTKLCSEERGGRGVPNMFFSLLFSFCLSGHTIILLMVLSVRIPQGQTLPDHYMSESRGWSKTSLSESQGLSVLHNPAALHVMYGAIICVQHIHITHVASTFTVVKHIDCLEYKQAEEL